MPINDSPAKNHRSFNHFSSVVAFSNATHTACPFGTLCEYKISHFPFMSLPKVYLGSKKGSKFLLELVSFVILVIVIRVMMLHIMHSIVLPDITFSQHETFL